MERAQARPDLISLTLVGSSAAHTEQAKGKNGCQGGEGAPKRRPWHHVEKTDEDFDWRAAAGDRELRAL